MNTKTRVYSVRDPYGWTFTHTERELERRCTPEFMAKLAALEVGQKLTEEVNAGAYVYRRLS